jgi:hypothetical protein
MPSMVKCESCGFEFLSRRVSFDDRQSFEMGSVPNNIIEVQQDDDYMRIFGETDIFEYLNISHQLRVNEPTSPTSLNPVVMIIRV